MDKIMKKQNSTNSKSDKSQNIAIRNEYASIGVKAFYESKGANYENPHFEQIEALLIKNLEKFDWSNVLDLSCGSGEVSLILKKFSISTIATDPYTKLAFEKNLNSTFFEYTFDDIIKGALDGFHFTTVICSFALHLCPEDKLFPLLTKILKKNTILGIITPHKRPDLRNLSFIEHLFDDFSLTEKGKKVYLNAYKLNYYTE